MKQYPDMRTLLQQEQEAKTYYDGLPEYVKEQISARADNVNSFDSLQNYAENLLRGDI